MDGAAGARHDRVARRLRRSDRRQSRGQQPDALYFDVAGNKLIEQQRQRRQERAGPPSGNFSFAGLADTYFAAVFLPEGSANDASR